MSNFFPVQISQIISLTAITTTIWMGYSNPKFLGKAVAAVDNVPVTSWTANNLIAGGVTVNQEIATLEQLTFERVNQYRAALNLTPLKLNPQISEQARIHSENMARSNVPLGHEGFKSRLEALKKTIAYRRGSENVAYNFGYDDPVSEAVAGWIDSPGHHQNMVGNYNLTGVGVAKNDQGEYYLTQIFILEP